MADERLEIYNLEINVKDVEMIRVGAKTFSPDGQLLTDHKTVNRAKRASREFQSRGGSLGDGRLRVAAKPPKQVQEAA